MSMSRALFPLSGLLMGGLLSATEISSVLPNYRELNDLVMSAAQGECRFNNAFFELCRMAVEQNDVAFFAHLPSSYLNADCGPLDSPFARMDGNPKATHYFAPVLLHAAAEGKADIVRVLLQRGADKEAEEYYGRTAIVYAAAKGHLACVQLLHRAGATKLDRLCRGNPLADVGLRLRRDVRRAEKAGA